MEPPRSSLSRDELEATTISRGYLAVMFCSLAGCFRWSRAGVRRFDAV